MLGDNGLVRKREDPEMSAEQLQRLQREERPPAIEYLGDRDTGEIDCKEGAVNENYYQVKMKKPELS